MKNIKTILCVMIVVLPLVASAIPRAAASSTTLAVINPLVGTNKFQFTTAVTHVNDIFIADIVVTDVQDLFGWQLNVTFDKTLLNVLEIDLPTDHIFAGKTILPAGKDINNDRGYVLWGVSLGPGMTAVSGSGKLCYIKFQIMKEPERKQELISTIVIDRVSAFPTLLLDPFANEIPFDPINGEYKFAWAPPVTTPYLELEPRPVKLAPGNEKLDLPYAFDIQVKIKNLDVNWQLVGVQFIIKFNATIIKATGATEGPFLSNYAFPEYGTLFMFYDDTVGTDGKLTVGILIYPNLGVYPPTYEGLPNGFPRGEGLICTLHFNLLYQGEFPWWTEIPVTIEPLFGNCFIDSDGDWIPFDPAMLKGTSVIVYGYVLGRVIDVYTEYYYWALEHGYSADFAKEVGGVGRNKPSDAFAPQDEVTLYALVTYNLDPVQNKSVAFEIIRPDGTKVAVLVGVTDENGIATVSFRIPWPCNDPEATIFGNWTVIATCDLAEQVITDTVEFRVGWLLEITKVTTAKPDYYKDEHVEFILELKTISKIQRDALITVTVTDDLNVPIGMIKQEIEFGEAELLGAKTWTINLNCMKIPKWAYIGTATVHANALTDWPLNGGTPYFKPEATATDRIIRP